MNARPWEEDPGDRLARLTTAFVQGPSHERKERMVAALHRYWRARNGSSGVGLLEEVAAMDRWADDMIAEHSRARSGQLLGQTRESSAAYLESSLSHVSGRTGLGRSGSRERR
jgi:hypothetical protein